VVLALAVNDTQLCTTPVVQSSLPATKVRLETTVPVYTASSVSKLLPRREACATG
jgi:hypothetical protein